MSYQVTQRYAQALFEVCEGTKDFDRAHADLQSISKLIDGSTEFKDFLENPVIPKEKQENVVTEIFEQKVSLTTLKYLNFLIHKGRLNLLQEICGMFDQLYLAAKGIINVKISTNVKLDERQLNALKTYLKKKFDKDIQTQLIIDPKTIGGIKIRIADEIFDYTIKTQLEEYRTTTAKAF